MNSWDILMGKSDVFSQKPAIRNPFPRENVVVAPRNHNKS